MSDIIDELFEKYSHNIYTADTQGNLNTCEQMMYKFRFRHAITEALEKQRELSANQIEKFLPNLREEYSDYCKSFILTTKLEEQK